MSDIAVCFCDDDGQVTLANDKAESLLGLPKSEIEGKNISDFGVSRDIIEEIQENGGFLKDRLCQLVKNGGSRLDCRLSMLTQKKDTFLVWFKESV